MARGCRAGGDHPEIGAGRTGAVSHQDRYRQIPGEIAGLAFFAFMDWRPAEQQSADWDRADWRALRWNSRLHFCAGVYPDVPDAVDGAEGDVRFAQPDF